LEYFLLSFIVSSKFQRKRQWWTLFQWQRQGCAKQRLATHLSLRRMTLPLPTSENRYCLPVNTYISAMAPFAACHCPWCQGLLADRSIMRWLTWAIMYLCLLAGAVFEESLVTAADCFHCRLRHLCPADSSGSTSERQRMVVDAKTLRQRNPKDLRIP
jgi:hypothetical protein